MLTNYLGHTLWSTLMDPRRARDPRLARADPRLQRPHSRSPAPVSTPPQVPTQYHQQWAENGVQNYPNQPTPQSQGIPYQQPVQQLPPASAPLPGPVTSPPAYRQRPLFCIVCASNQVCPHPIFHEQIKCYTLTRIQNRSMEGHDVLA